MADRDAVVGKALDLLQPEFDVDAGAVLAGARTDAAGLLAKRRRRQTVAALALAGLLLLGGAAVAAQKLDLFSFLHTKDRNTARFSISPSRAYHGAAPAALTCPTAHAGPFVCHVTGQLVPGKRLYELGSRTAKVPLLTRHSMLTHLAHAQAQGADSDAIARAKTDLAAVGDEFIRALGVMLRIETISSSSGGRSGTERVPPAGVPAWVACREVTLVSLRCRPLAAQVAVAGGTPLYFLQPSRDWRRVKEPKSQTFPLESLLERLLGRKPNAAETRFLFDFLTAAATASGHSTPARSTTIGVPGPHAAALLGPGTLGLPTRAVSATALPLPHERLPGGLTRSDHVRLYRVVFDLRRADRSVSAGRHTLYVYVARTKGPPIWGVAWVSTKP